MLVDYYTVGKFLNKRAGWYWCCGCLAALAGCVGAITTPEGESMRLNSEQFRAYVAQTFRAQNRIADELAFAILDADEQGKSDYVRRLEVLDERLSIACAGINELAVAQRDGIDLGARRKLELARQVPGCDGVAAEVATQLP